MKCPSDLAAQAANNPDGGNNFGTFDKGNYGLNVGGGCPNENGGNGAGPHESPTWATAQYGKASINRGVAHWRDGATSPVQPTSTGLHEMLDGTSNCFLVGEMLKFSNNGDCRGCWGKAYGSIVSAYTIANPNTDGPNGIATPNVKAVGIYRDGPTHCANTPTIGDPQMECVDGGGDGLRGVAMRSRHPGGVQATYGDARVAFVSNTIDKVVYRAIFTIQGGEVTQGQ